MHPWNHGKKAGRKKVQSCCFCQPNSLIQYTSILSWYCAWLAPAAKDEFNIWSPGKWVGMIFVKIINARMDDPSLRHCCCCSCWSLPTEQLNSTSFSKLTAGAKNVCLWLSPWVQDHAHEKWCISPPGLDPCILILLYPYWTSTCKITTPNTLCSADEGCAQRPFVKRQTSNTFKYVSGSQSTHPISYNMPAAVFGNNVKVRSGKPQVRSIRKFGVPQKL